MTAGTKYLHFGIVILVASAAIATYLNFQGAKCLTDIARLDRSVVSAEQVDELERNCAITTNSYVYSIYGIVGGIILVVIGFMKKRKTDAS
jgi:hypothetical protein